jgi:hypothetical protein
MTSPDEHLATLRELSRVFGLVVRQSGLILQRGDGILDPATIDTMELCRRRRDALDWILAETAYGVEESEVVT